MRALSIVLLSVGLTGLGTACAVDFFICPAPDEEKLEGMPELLSQTGLYTDIGAGTITPEALLFRPQFKLWTDGADKRRWLQIPVGETIDTSDMDAWRFPVGTKVWKEFSREGTYWVEENP